MANEQSKRQSERQGERGLATRRYQDPFTLLDSLFERMQRDVFGTSFLNALVPGRGSDDEGLRAVRMPRVQMRDAGDALEVKAEMPGIDGRNVSVLLEDNVLTISGEQRQEEEGDEERTERYISFYRQIPLPDGIDAEQSQASYRDGVLTIRFPRMKARANAREIPVQTQQTGQQAGQSPAKERAA